MCSLQALGAAQKYASSYERVAKSISSFINGSLLIEAREQFFATLVLSVILRNGDAHLKNFGVLYASPFETVQLAPVYDVVTTTAYIKKDVPALTLSGTKKWWTRTLLERFAVSHLSLPISTVSNIIEKTAQSVSETRSLIPDYMNDHPEFEEIGSRMLAAWDEGLNELMK